MRFLITVFSLFTLSFANLNHSNLVLDSNVVALKLYEDELFIGLDNGTLQKYDMKDRNLTTILTLPKISNYFDENIPSKIYDISKFDEKVAILFEGQNGTKRIGIYDNELKVLEPNFNYIKNIYFSDKNELILLSLSSEVHFFDILKNKITDSIKLTTSGLGGNDFDLKNSKLAIGSEGGVIYMIDTKKRSLIGEIDAQKDNIYSLSLKEDSLISGSTDKSAFFKSGSESKLFGAGFLVYCVGLSKDYGAYTGEDFVAVFDTKTKELIKSIPYNGVSLNYLIFYEDELIGCGYDKLINFWRVR